LHTEAVAKGIKFDPNDLETSSEDIDSKNDEIDAEGEEWAQLIYKISHNFNPNQFSFNFNET